MKEQAYILEHHAEVLAFLRTRFPIYHQSNIFFRDIQYGILTYLERKGMRVGYTDAERIAREFTAKLEKEGTFLPIDRQTWVVNYPQYRKPPVKPAAPAARPAPPAAPKPAAAAPKTPPAAVPAAPPSPTGEQTPS
ncbi:MAG: hypothetical protein AB1428_04715 [Bacteroidota bacterium]